MPLSPGQRSLLAAQGPGPTPDGSKSQPWPGAGCSRWATWKSHSCHHPSQAVSHPGKRQRCQGGRAELVGSKEGWHRPHGAHSLTVLRDWLVCIAQHHSCPCVDLTLWPQTSSPRSKGHMGGRSPSTSSSHCSRYKILGKDPVHMYPCCRAKGAGMARQTPGATATLGGRRPCNAVHLSLRKC